MKLILGSDLSFLLAHGYRLTGIAKQDMKIGYITTAAKGEKDSSFFEGIKRSIGDHGYPIEEIDIEGKSETELKEFFRDKNIIQIEGGNTFYLLKVIRKIGFDKLLKELLSHGKVFIGISAGAYIMCPTIDVAAWDNDKDRFGVTNFDGLNYVPFVLRVHYTDSIENLIKEKEKTLKYPLKILRDGQGILIDDHKIQVFG